MHYTIVDAFTTEPFRGNPAAVVLLSAPQDDSRLQAIAAEFNLAETAYLLPLPNRQWSLRWFTPTTEMDLCGHATLASAHMLWQEMGNDSDSLSFATLSGELRARRVGDMIQLDFPSIANQEVAINPAESALLRLDPIATAHTKHNLIVELANADSVRQYQPKIADILTLPYRGLIITAKSDRADADFVVRFFAPHIGIPEDPVTGAIHCALGPYWGKKLSKSHLLSHQVSSRGGVLHVTVADERILIAGHAITTMRGEIMV